MKKVKHKPLNIVAVAALLAVLVPALATGDRLSTVPGVKCRYYNKLGGDNYFSPIGHKANGLKNTSSSDKYVTCPVEWDILFDKLYTTIYIRTNGQPSECTLYMVDLTTDFGSGDYDTIPLSVRYMDEGVYQHYSSSAGTFGDAASIYCKIKPSGIINGYMYFSVD